MLSTLQEVGAGLAGLGGGVLSGFFGVGGNVVLVPLLAATLGLTQQQAQGLTLAALLPPLGLPAVLEYRRSGVPLLWPVVGFAIVGFLPGIPLGSALANLLPPNVLRLIFAVPLLIQALRTWARKPAEVDAPLRTTAPEGFARTTVVAGFLAGCASGLLGIGGAIVLIPLLTGRVGLNQKQAQLTSLAMLLPPIALPGVWVYARAQGALPWGALVPVALGFLVGSFSGARLARLISSAKLARGFAVVLAASAVGLIIAALRG